MVSPIREHYRPIHDYGLIGDCSSAALVSSDGSVDWWCPARFDGPSVFAAVLDREKGGFFRLHAERLASTHEYVEGTNVLRTRWRSSTAEFEVLDFMVPQETGRPPRLHRLVRGLRGEAMAALEYVPRFDYGRVGARFSRGKHGHLLATGAGQTLALASSVPLEVEDGWARARFAVREGEESFFSLSHANAIVPRPGGMTLGHAREDLEATYAYWREWLAPNRYEGPYKEAVLRSALVLKLLTYQPTGAVVAAPTMSLPEWVGGERNWDYRYSWVRDAVFCVRALGEVGHDEEAKRFVEWLVLCAERDPGSLRVLYTVTGDAPTPERDLEHLEGYRRSRPVRVGNAAEHQFQLDVYGELVEGSYAAGLLVDSDDDRWAYFCRLADFVADNWRRPDQGIWEFRSRPRNFVLSKAMAWAALERSARAAAEHGLPGDVERWRAEAASVREDVLEKGYDASLGAFKQSYEDAVLDASNLLLPLIGFLPADDPRMLSTIDRTLDHLTVNGLVYRYLDADDGVAGGEATFSYCTFWLAEVLALAGRVDEATRLFEGMLARASPLGLYGEELHPVTGEHLGNYPQGFPHIGLIRAARRLARATRDAAREAPPPQA